MKRIRDNDNARISELSAHVVVNNDISENINNVDLWENGVIFTDGSETDNTARLRTKDYLENNRVILSIATGYSFTLAVFESDGTTWLGYSGNAMTFSKTTATYATSLDISPLGSRKARIIIKNNDSVTVLSPNDASNVQINPINYSLSLKNIPDSDSDVWNIWAARLAFGMDKVTAPVPVVVDGQLFVDGTLILHNSETAAAAGTRNRWGFHVLEAYSNNNYDRYTTVLNKHDAELEKEIAEQYYYIGSDHAAASYGWVRVGSDVQRHSFLFDRDELLALGRVNLKNVMTLARIAPSTDLITTYSTVAAADAAYDAESDYQNKSENNAKCLLYLALKNAENGAMFYDTERDKIVAKVGGIWCDVNVTDASAHYTAIS